MVFFLRLKRYELLMVLGNYYRYCYIRLLLRVLGWMEEASELLSAKIIYVWLAWRPQRRHHPHIAQCHRNGTTVIISICFSRLLKVHAGVKKLPSVGNDFCQLLHFFYYVSDSLSMAHFSDQAICK